MMLTGKSHIDCTMSLSRCGDAAMHAQSVPRCSSRIARRVSCNATQSSDGGNAAGRQPSAETNLKDRIKLPERGFFAEADTKGVPVEVLINSVYMRFYDIAYRAGCVVLY